MNTDELLHEKTRFWAVRIDGVNGPGLALDGNGGRSLFSGKNAALKYRAELQAHLSSPCTVIQVDAIFDQIPF